MGRRDHPPGAAVDPELPPPALQPGRTGRLEHLDALRGIAALLVVLQHVLEAVAVHPAAPGWYVAAADAFGRTYFGPGRMGVVAFFLISGYVVPFSLKRPHALGTFAISRFFRLYPAYWLSLLLSVTLLPLLGLNHFPARQTLANVTMLQFALHQPDVIGAYWTLFIELAFYVCCAFWFTLGVLRSARFLALAACGLVALALAAAVVRFLHPTAAIPVGYVNYLAAMHIGTLARLATLEQDGTARRLLRPVVAVALVTTVAIGWLAYSRTPGAEPWIGSVTGPVAGYALFFHCIARRAFVNRATLWLGATSYSLYLLHGLMLRFGRALGFALPWWQGSAVIALFTLVLSALLAALVFRWVERPTVTLGHRLMRRLRAPSGATPAAA